MNVPLTSPSRPPWISAPRDLRPWRRRIVGEGEDPRSDEALLAAAQAGEARATAVLIWRYEGIAWGIGRQYYAPGSDLADLIQVGRLALLGAIRRYQADREIPFYRYAQLAVQRAVQTACTAARRRKHQPLSEAVRLVGSDDWETSAWEWDFSDGFDEAALVDRLWLRQVWAWAREHLSPLEYGALVGVCRRDPYVEIAARLGVGKKAVDNALSRVKEKLRAQFGGQE
jgi:RNA polymerase sporulation-specific sigma factor